MVECTFAPVLTESCSLHSAHIIIELATDKHRFFGRRRLVNGNIDSCPDSGTGPKGAADAPRSIDESCLDGITFRAGLVVNVLVNLVAEVLRNAKESGLTWGSMGGRRVYIS